MVARTSIDHVESLHDADNIASRDACQQYLINLIAHRPSAKIIDIGCGTNWIKRLDCMQPHEVIGIDRADTGMAHGETPQPDVNAMLESDNAYCEQHQQNFDHAVALCSLHYCMLDDLPTQINLALTMIKSGGLLLVTANTQRMLYKAVELKMTAHSNKLIEQFSTPWIHNYGEWLKSQSYDGTMHTVMTWNSNNEPTGNIMLLISK